MKIVKLTAENVKRLKAVEIVPDGPMVKITGKNGQGKSSVLDSLWWALGGSKAVQEDPIHHGENKASIRLELDDLVVTRTFTPGNTYLKVENRDGASFKSPQSILDKLVGQLSFDPLAFAQADPKTQRALLLQVTGITVDQHHLTEISGTYLHLPGETALDTLNATYKHVFAERTVANRVLEQAKASLAAMPEVEAVEPVSVTDLLRERRALERERQRRETAERELDGYLRRESDLGGEIDDLLRRLEQKRQELETVRQLRAALQEGVRMLPPIDFSVIDARIANAEAINTQAQAYATRQKTVQDAADLQAEADDFTRRLDAIKAYQQELVANAHFPIEGLGFANGGVTYQGVPFAQAADSEKLRVSLAMAMALNPDLRVIRVRNGNLLDAASMALVEEMARDRDYQFWMEIVADDGAVGVYIEDGTVAAVDGRKPVMA